MDERDPLHCPIVEVVSPSNEELGELEPLLHHLQANHPILAPITFPRGTLMPDGRLDLCKQHLGPIGCRRVVDALANNTHIASLMVGTDGIGDAGAADVARLIACNDRLSVLYLGCNQITATGAATLARALETNHHVVGLWLKRNPIGPQGAHAIAHMLRRNTSLRTLDLVNTQLGAQGLRAILDVLTHDNRSVARVYLGGNQLDADAARGVATMLEANPAITAVLLNVNHLGDTGIAALASALEHNQTLIELGLASNGITAAGGARLAQAITDHPALALLDLGYSPSTVVPGAHRNTLSDAGAAAFGALLRRNTSLRRIDLRSNGIGAEGRAAVVAALEHNTTVLQILVDGKPDPRLTHFLQRNCALHPTLDAPLAPDVAFIRSVYRTATTPHASHHPHT